MKKVLVIVAVAAGFSLELQAQDAKAVIDTAANTIGATSLRSIEYSGTGSTYGFGQAIGPGQAWPRFTMTRYAAAINYLAPALREEIVRVDDENPPRGGGAGPFNPATGQGGIRPIPFGPQTQTRQLAPRTEGALIQLWMMTPHGFLKAAAANSATVTTASVRGRRVQTVSFALGRHTVTGTIDDQHLVERVETRLDNNVLGDMHVETTYADYKDFAGVKFPTRIVLEQGGYPTLDVTVAGVQPNSAASAALESLVSAPAGGGAPAPVKVEGKKLADGVWFLDGGAPMSYLVECADHLVMIEGPGNDARTEEAIREAKRLAPAKPIRYVVNTHEHFDHAGGIRGVAAAGITIITHQVNKPYFERIFKNPHTLSPDNLARSSRTAVIEAVGGSRVLSDGTNTIEIHHVRGNLHDPGLLMVYLPRHKMLIQADAFAARPPDARPLPGPSPFTVNLLENIERLKLDVQQILHLHGGVEPFANLVRAAGR